MIADNNTSLQIAREARLKEASKHILIYKHFIKEKVEHGDIALKCVPSTDNLADILTKGLGGQPHNKVAILMGIYLATGGGGAEEEC